MPSKSLIQLAAVAAAPTALLKWHRSIARAVNRTRQYFRVYDASDADAAVFRARQLQTVLQLSPVLMLVNVFNAAVVCLVVWTQAPALFLLSWLAVITVLAMLGLRGWYRTRLQPPRRTASPRAMVHATVQATLLGSAWAALPACVAAGLDGMSQFIVGMVMIGMICAGGFALCHVPVAATSWVLLLGLGSLVGVQLSGLDAVNVVVGMLSLYCLIVVHNAWTSAKTFGARVMAEACADRQHEVIGLLLRDFEDHASDLLWELDAAGRFRQVSQRLASVLRFSAASLRRHPAARLLGRALPDSADARSHWEALLQHLARGTAFREQIVSLSGPDGTTWWSLSARQFFDASGQTTGWRGVAANVTDKHLAHCRLSWLAHNDALTGLVNRTQFRELLHALLHRAGVPVAVVLLDLDGFKQVNDTQGHLVGHPARWVELIPDRS